MKVFIQKNIPIFPLLLGLLLVASCANIAYPTGGPADSEPPKMLEAVPKDGSTHFSGKEIHFVFDEYIALKNASSEFISSPPLKEKPKIETVGKGFKVVLDEDLMPNTTYTFLFGNAVTDNNEGNILRDFSYTFSTGDYLDSLEFEGVIKNAFTLTPESGVFVGLYTSLEDSVVYKEKPYYVAKTDSSGYFRLRALKQGEYKIIACRDMNNNFKFDLVTEDIAFDENPVSPKIPKKKPDIADSVVVDSLKSETLKDTLLPKQPVSQYEMLMFPEMDIKQGVVFSEFLEDGHVMIAMKKPMQEFQFQLLFKEGNMSFIEEFSDKKDTLNIWFLDGKIDSISLDLKDGDFTDTVKIKREPLHDKKPKKINIVSVGIDSKVPFFTQPAIVLKNPVNSIDSEKKTLLIKGNDTVEVALKSDSLKRKMSVDYRFQEDSAYTLIIDSAYFTDIYGYVNNPLNYSFKLDKKENYGNFSLKFNSQNFSSQYIVQLLTDRDIPVKEYIVRETEKLDFPHLKSGNYRIKVIEDVNKNNIWDSGNYWEKRHAEKVRFLEKPISIRENWDLIESFVWE